MATATCSWTEVLRGPKLLDMAIFDWAASLLAAFVIGRFLLHATTAAQWVAWIVFWIWLGVFVHMLVGVPTMFGYYLGLNPRPLRKECKSMIE